MIHGAIAANRMWRTYVAPFMLGSFALVLFIAGTAASEPRPEVTAGLLSDSLYVGEVGELVLTIKAPEDKDIQVIKEDRVHKRRVLDLELKTLAGERLPGGLPRGFPIEKADDFQTLKRGQSVSITSELLTSGGIGEGRYEIHIRFRPTPDPNVEFVFQIPLTFLGISPSAIRDRISFKVPSKVGIGLLPEDIQVLEFLNVKGPLGANYLYYRRIEHPDKIVVCKRLLLLDDESRMVGSPLFFGSEENYAQRQTMIVYNTKGQLHLLRVEFVVGSVLEHKVLTMESGNGEAILGPVVPAKGAPHEGKPDNTGVEKADGGAKRE